MFWKKNTRCYQILVPPVDKPICKMNKAEAKAYFDWYIGEIPGRVMYLQEQSGIRLDGTEESLIRIWNWFIKNAEIENTSDADLQELRNQSSPLGEPFVKTVLEQSTRTLSLKTKYILQDIAMYWGDVFIKNYPSISWDINANADDFRNQPVLVGFINDVFPDKPGMPFPPYHMASVQASRLLRGRADRGDLLRIHRIWIAKIIGER